MDIEISTAALLFPTASLMLLAYTNRFLGLAKVVRDLAQQYSKNHERVLIEQIKNLQRRLQLIRDMQAFGVLSLFACVASMFALFVNNQPIGKIAFATSLILLLVSLAISFYEVLLSTNALSIQLGAIKKELKQK